MTARHHFAVRYPDLSDFPRELDEKIAVHGLHLKTQKDVQVGEGVAIQFRFPQREDPLRAAGVIAWVSAQPDPQGKRSLVVRNLAFDSSSQEVLDLVRSTPPPEEAVVAAAPPPPPPAAPEPRPPAPRPEPRPAPAEPVASVDVDSDEDDEAAAAAAEAARRKRLAIVGGVTATLLVLLLVWLTVLGGSRWVAMSFMAPPDPLTVGRRSALPAGPEPAPPAPPKAPAPKVVPYALATSFDYFQRPAENEFTVTFNRPIGQVVTTQLKSGENLIRTFYVERAKSRLEKEQYFLPFKLVRTVSFEEQDGNLRVSFVSQNPYYLPEPIWESRGRELIVRFLAQDED